MTPAELEEFERPILVKYEMEESPYCATSRLLDDGVITTQNIPTFFILGVIRVIFRPRPTYIGLGSSLLQSGWRFKVIEDLILIADIMRNH